MLDAEAAVVGIDEHGVEARGGRAFRRPLTCGAFDESGRVGYRFKARVSYTLLLLPTGLSSPEMVTPAGGVAGLTATS
jgi:hypothetical protein